MEGDLRRPLSLAKKILNGLGLGNFKGREAHKSSVPDGQCGAQWGLKLLCFLEDTH